ncbi:MAG: hypothetical protein M1831_007454 [Alyxoria varia]|nr:MAG: hypothetical protein M1831_007454 [Alyxoria varia]
MGDPSHCPIIDADSKCYKIFLEVNKLVRADNGPESIDEVNERLDQIAEHDPVYALPNRPGERRLLVFTMLAWQTMLYVPSFNTCSPAELEICEPHRSNSGRVFETFKVPADLCDRPFAILFKAFGNLLPPRVITKPDQWIESEGKGVQGYCIDVLDFNMTVFKRLLHIELRWIDTLALHLDYNKTTRTLTLFRYPSMCHAALKNSGAIYSFACSEGPGALDPRGDREDITDLLRETLQSYRLLFGQTRRSRKLFKRFRGSSGVLQENPDPLLHSLSTSELSPQELAACLCEDRNMYCLNNDFPILGQRLKALNEELKASRPKNWRDLLRDRRDTVQYWTFWLVAIFGTLSTLLSAAQVVLTALTL